MAKTAPTLPYEWLRSIPRDLAALDTVPLMGFPPKFPWEDFSEKLQTTLGLKSLKVTTKAPEWRTKKKLFSGMSGDLIPLTFSVPGMEGVGHWVMNAADLNQLMGYVLMQTQTPFPFEDADFQEGFTRFLGLEMIHSIGKTEFDPTLSPHLERNGSLPEEAALTFDLSAKIGRRSLKSRLFLSKELQEACKSHYAKGAEHAAASGRLSQSLEVELHMEIGRSQIDRSEWSHVGIGDFIVLDSCSWLPDEQKGRVILTLSQTPLFRGRLKKGKIKILEYPLYHEVDTMTSELHEEEESAELSFDEESDLEPEESLEEGLEENVEEPHEEGTREEGEPEMEGEEEGEEISELPVAEEEAPPVEEEEMEAPDEPAEDVVVSKPQKPQSPETIPLNVVVEAGRLKMTIQKLSELHPGNILDLNIRPEAGVDLVVNGRCVAKGELLKIGETLGVRVLEIG